MIFHNIDLGSDSLFSAIFSSYRVCHDIILLHVSMNMFLFNPFPNTPILNCPKFKEAADNNLNVTINPFPNDKF